MASTVIRDHNLLLHINNTRIACVHSELSVNTGQFAKSAAMVGNTEEHTSLSRALSQLAEIEERIDQLHADQADADFFVLAELIKDYVGMVGAVKVRSGFTVGNVNVRSGFMVGDVNVRSGFTVGDVKERSGFTVGDVNVTSGFTVGDVKERSGFMVRDVNVRLGFMVGDVKVRSGFMVGDVKVRSGFMVGDVKVRSGFMVGDVKVRSGYLHNFIYFSRLHRYYITLKAA